MLKILLNISMSADANLSLSLINQFLKFIITNISAPYAVCGSIIVLCMFATTLRNLIYKVLNLAVLSVFVVALWAYLTDVTFIYVVYILTFVSAVVMLFLSVVLMLPSSAIAVSKRNFSFVLSTATVSTSEGGIVSAIANISIGIVCSCLVLAGVYFVIAFLKSWKVLNTYRVYGHPQVHIIPFSSEDIDVVKYKEARENMQRLSNNYDFYVYANRDPNRYAVGDCATSARCDADFGSFASFMTGTGRYLAEYGYPAIRIPAAILGRCFKIRLDDQQRHLPEPVMSPIPEELHSFYPKYVRAVPHLVKTPSRYRRITQLRNTILMVPYEFINFYIRRIEPAWLFRVGFYYRATCRFRKFANAMPSYKLENAAFSSGRGRYSLRFPLGGDETKLCFLSFYTPWWSPFRVFNGPAPKYAHNYSCRYPVSPEDEALDLEKRWAAKGLAFGYVHPAAGSYVYKYVKSVFSNCVSLARVSARAAGRFVYVAKNQLDVFKMHPALVIKLSSTRALWPAYSTGAACFRAVGQVFNHVEVPLSSASGGWSMYGLFAGFYDGVLPYTSGYFTIGYSSKPAQYLINNIQHNRSVFIKNFIIFVVVNLFFNIANIVAYIAMVLTSTVSIELIAQVATTVSIFFTAVPVGLAGTWAGFTYSFYVIDAGTSGFAENLLAIQHGLYVSQPLLLLVSITGLLVALIGAPFFVSRGK